MQDSIEDYLKISKNKKQDEPKIISKDIILAAERKKQCNERASKIVEFSIDGKLQPEVFLKCLPYIEQTHYQDIVEERAISKLCGYPICGKKIPPMPTKQYHISTKHNKVYDITERKNYCSNFCYNAGIHIKKQIDTSPLWLRKLDDIPKYNLLPVTDKSVPGVEIDQGIAKPVTEPSFTSVTSFTHLSLVDMIEDEIGGEKVISKKQVFKKASSKTHMETIRESADDDTDVRKMKTATKYVKKVNKEVSQEEKRDEPEKPCKSDDNKETNGNSNIDGSSTSSKNSEKHKTKKSSKKKTSKSSPIVSVDIENHMKKCFEDWFTLETHILIFGEKQVREKVADEKFMEFFNSLKTNEDRRIQRMKYIDICRKLHLKELSDEKFDKKLLGDTSLEPLPDYKILTEESKQLDLKVRSFYGGTLYEADDPNFKTKCKEESQNSNQEEGPPAVLPLIDTKSQTALRRNIFLSSAKKAMQTLIQKLKVPPLSIISDLHSLVKTFELRPDNIVFKPHIWNYMSVALLKVLSLKDEEIQEALEEEKGALEYINVILNELPSGQEFVNYALDLVKNSDFLIKKYLNDNKS